MKVRAVLALPVLLLALGLLYVSVLIGGERFAAIVWDSMKERLK